MSALYINVVPRLLVMNLGINYLRKVSIFLICIRVRLEDWVNSRYGPLHLWSMSLMGHQVVIMVQCSYGPGHLWATYRRYGPSLPTPFLVKDALVIIQAKLVSGIFTILQHITLNVLLYFHIFRKDLSVLSLG